MYSSSTLLAVLIFLIIVNIIAIIALYRVNRKRKRQNEKLIAGWQKQNDYMDHNVEFCSKAREITQQVRRAIESYDPQQMEKDCLDECNVLLSFIHGGSSAQEALILDKKSRCDALGIRFIDEIRVLPADGTIQEIDIISLLGNLLDNAIEACRASGSSDPYIRIESTIKKKVWQLTVSNSKDPEISPKKTGMATTKKDARDHGLGIGIIRSIVSKYNGTLKMNDCGDSVQIFGKCKMARFLILNRFYAKFMLITSGNHYLQRGHVHNEYCSSASLTLT